MDGSAQRLGLLGEDLADGGADVGGAPGGVVDSAGDGDVGAEFVGWHYLISSGRRRTTTVARPAHRPRRRGIGCAVLSTAGVRSSVHPLGQHLHQVPCATPGPVPDLGAATEAVGDDGLFRGCGTQGGEEFQFAHRA